jgi:hypothetical protein
VELFEMVESLAAFGDQAKDVLGRIAARYRGPSTENVPLPE